MKFEVTMITTALMRGVMTVEADSYEDAETKAVDLAESDLGPDWEIDDIYLDEIEPVATREKASVEAALAPEEK